MQMHECLYSRFMDEDENTVYYTDATSGQRPLITNDIPNFLYAYMTYS